MRFEENHTIFLQIAEQFCWDILNGRWEEGGRLPSLRETAVELQVNPNTVVKAYAELEYRQVIYKQRGLGYFISHGAKEKITQIKREEFFDNELPKFLRNLKMLEIGEEELCRIYKEFISEDDKK